ncbi:MAG TPA: metal-binding protein [Blastocatellia bacterium]|nr:metal-binding protein [Blastocatellia bacterium]
MPSGKTHDLITFVLALPTAVAAWAVSGSIGVMLIATIAMLFGGLMFGPDLDLHSVQYSRWGPFRLLWWPYQVCFKHRSRFSHGLIFGTAIRVIYFSIVLILLSATIIYLRDSYLLGVHNNAAREVERAASGFWLFVSGIDRNYLIAAFAGAWWGAASHTLSDLIFSVGKQTKKIF